MNQSGLDWLAGDMTGQNDRAAEGFGDSGRQVAQATRVRRWVLWVVGGLLALTILVAVGRFLNRSGPRGGLDPRIALPPAPPEAVPLPGLSPSHPAQPALADSAPGHLREPSLGTLKSGMAETQVEPAAPTTVAAAAEEMRQVARRVLVDFPNQPDALEISARAHLALGESTKAAEDWQRCLALAPDYSYAYCGLAMVALNKGDRQEAARLLRKALTITPRVFEARFELAKALFEDGRVQESLEVLEELVRDHPRSARSYTLLGAAYLQTSALEKAKQAYETAIRLNPQDEYPYLGLATACARLGRAEEAKRHREKFAELRSGSLQESRGRHRGFDDMGRMCNALAEVCTNAGRLYRVQGKLAEAESLCRRAAQIAPRHVESRQALAWLYGQSGRTPEAIRMLEQLAEIQPFAATYPLEIARLYTTLGQKDKADPWLRRARDLDPTKGQHATAHEGPKQK